MGWWLLLAIFLYLACALLIIAEVFVPSGGLLSICALVCVAGGVMLFWQQSEVAGYIGIGVAVVMIPTLLVISYKIFPKTRFGKSAHLTPSERKPGDASPGSEQFQELMGKQGIVLRPMRPVGLCKIDGRRVECVAESGYVEKDRQVKVIRVQGSTVTVRAIETE